jgi:asparagine synthase (glutamine-hydrolysing)
VFNSSRPLQFQRSVFMPGIVGLIQAGPVAQRERALAQMLHGMMHESFYASGSWQMETLHTGVGWVCHPGAFSDGMPAWNETHDICLVFWGEHFAGTGAHSTAASLVRLYEQHGAKFFGMLNGVFHGLVLDLREKKAVLFNDRYGLARLYFHESADGFYFAAEAKSLLKVLPRLRRLDARALGEFFSCGCALQDRTLFEGVSLLPAGAMWTFRPGVPPKKESYFNRRDWEEQPALSPEDYYAKLRETFQRILPGYLGGPNRVALSLTGGLDSRMIAAAAHAPAGTLPTYTFGGQYRDCADVTLSRQIAKVCRQTHQVIPIYGELFAQFPDLAGRSVYYSDGAMDVTGGVELFANRQARQIAPVRLTGNYGGEILRGYVAFKPGELGEGIFDPGFVPSVRRAAATFEEERKMSPTAFIAFKQVPWHHFGRSMVERSQIVVRSPYLDNDLVRLVFQAPMDSALGKELMQRLIAGYDPALARIPTDRGRARPPAGVPARLWQWGQEFLPRAEYAYDYGMPQWMARIDGMLAPFHFERLFLGWQKFAHFRVWYRDQLAGYVQDMLLDSRSLSRSYLNSQAVERMTRDHVRGRGNYTLEIHKLLTAELIHRQLLEAPAAL